MIYRFRDYYVTTTAGSNDGALFSLFQREEEEEEEDARVSRSPLSTEPCDDDEHYFSPHERKVFKIV